jgi:hypothetical protein
MHLKARLVLDSSGDGRHELVLTRGEGKAAGQRDVRWEGAGVVAAMRIHGDGILPVERVVDEVIAYVKAGAARVAIHVGEFDGTRGRMYALAARLAGSFDGSRGQERHRQTVRAGR